MEKQNTASNTTHTPIVVPASVRADGTVRKERKVRPGFISQEQKQRYVPPARKRLQVQEKENSSEHTEQKSVIAPPTRELENKPQAGKTQSAPKRYIPPHRRKEQEDTLTHSHLDQSPKAECKELASTLKSGRDSHFERQGNATRSNDKTGHESNVEHVPERNTSRSIPKNPSDKPETDDLADALSQIKLK